ncbi:glycosyltransferase [Candidatus Pelagibacter sp.]|uniref:glycosyltransferase n=1 Tax=Candidatus Pelagibacter sp. TaxID=2024849 RepID=UPI003F85E735
MKISILLPLKENFSPIYPGAVSIFINDTLNHSKFKKNITVFGSTNYKKKFDHNYINLKAKNNIFQSQNKKYVHEFKKHEIKKKSDIIEVHNRPSYIRYIQNFSKESKLILYFHNDPLSMNGSKYVFQRKYLLKNCEKIVFNSNWSKNRFINNLNLNNNYKNKICIIHQSTKKNIINFKNKKKFITFVGKLNINKGYDLFGAAIIKILNKYKDWTGLVAGDEVRDKIIFRHPRLKILGFQSHQNIIKLFKKSSIAVVCSRWDEPFGRVSLEASANGCAVIISNKGGLPETNKEAIVLKKLDVINIYKEIENLILNKKKRIQLQKKSHKNFYLSNNYASSQIDNLRKENLLFPNLILKKNIENLKIIHVTNFNERFNGRLFFNTGKRINNGFVRLGHSVLEFSDRDITHNNKNYSDVSGAKNLNKKLIQTCENFQPDLIVLGHADLIKNETLQQLKINYPNLKIAQWFLDPLGKRGPDYQKNKKRIMDKMNFIDKNFLTTSPRVLNFLNNDKNFFIPNPIDPSFETLNNFNKNCDNDVFFAMSHGVHRGVLKPRYFDERTLFLEKLIKKSRNVKFDFYGINNIQPIWSNNFLKIISNCKMGLNLSRGKPLKYYSSDRIAQIVGNGLVTLIDENTQYENFFNKNEMVFYKNISDLSEKILKICKDEKLRKKIAKNGKAKYMKYFNSNNVANYIIRETFDLNVKNFYWHH